MDFSTVPLGRFQIASDHPCLEGHFPGHPLVPGVVLLDEVLTRLATHLGCGTPIRVRSVKFLAPVLPGDTVEVALGRMGADRGSIGFACLVRGNQVVTGVAAFA